MLVVVRRGEQGERGRKNDQRTGWFLYKTNFTRTTSKNSSTLANALVNNEIANPPTITLNVNSRNIHHLVKVGVHQITRGGVPVGFTWPWKG